MVSPMRSLPWILLACAPTIAADGLSDLNKLTFMVTTVSDQLAALTTTVNNTVVNTNNPNNITSQTYSIQYAADYVSTPTSCSKHR